MTADNSATQFFFSKDILLQYYTQLVSRLCFYSSSVTIPFALSLSRYIDNLLTLVVFSLN